MFSNTDSPKIGIMFGGITVEHEVSIITGVQAMKHAQKKHQVTPIYIDKSGKWWTGSKLFDSNYYTNQNLHTPTGLTPFTLNPNPKSNDIDVAILCFHGQYGESGKIQGLLDLAQIPYQGPGVTSSAICFDKIHVRQILDAEHLSQPDYIWFTDTEWNNNQNTIINKIDTTLSYPIFVKPANGGSTVGIQKATNASHIKKAVEQALSFDTRIIVESGITDCIEVNVSVLGTQYKTQVSVPEQPISQDEFLSYADKYERGGGKKTGMASANRRIPAPISSQNTQLLQKKALEVFRVLGCSGVIRIDFFINPSTNEYYVIEPNAIPGSMSYYLWEATAIPYESLIDHLIEIAYTREKASSQLIQSYDSNILQKR